MVTGIKDIDIIILNKLDDRDLVNMSRVNKYVYKLCNDQTFWLNRILYKFKLPIEVMTKYKGDRSWSEYYITDLKMIKNENSNKYLINGSTYGRLDHVMISLKMGADIHAYEEEAIAGASRNGYINIVKYLVKMGADIHAYDEEAIGEASRYGHIDIVRYLVESGADIHGDDDLAIIMASESGHIDIVKYLVEVGANIHADNNEAIRLAYRNNRMDVVNYLKSLP